VTTAIVRRRGQITLPSRIRKRLGLSEGDHIAILLQGDQVFIRPITQTLFDLRGSIPVEGPQDFEAIRKQVLSDRLRRSSDES
jgi:AbrB family looped-hinge helix DNA binding protein